MSMTISSYFASDHDQIDGLFERFRAVKGEASSVSVGAYSEFKTRLERHIGWEEGVPLFERLTGRSNSGPTVVMRSEHRQIEGFLDSMDATLRSGDAGVDADESALLEVLAAHNWKEEHVLYPLIDRQISPEDRDEVFARLAAEIGNSAAADSDGAN